jgi:predicted DNA-binding antitoxin AbrB/MazE fold protein
MTMTLQAVFENGVLRPLAPLSLPEGQQVQVLVAVEDVAKRGTVEMESDSRKAEDLSDEEYEAVLDSLCEGPDLPILPDSAFTREGIYEGG